MIGQHLNSEEGVARIRQWAHELGFSQIGVGGVDLSSAEAGLLAWLQAGCHGEMAYMQRHGLLRARPAELVSGAISVISARMEYLSPDCSTDWCAQEWAALRDPARAGVSVYARGRDYHKVVRSRLQALAQRIAAHIAPLGYRVFSDSAPLLEAELAVRSGLGWRGKHTLVLAREAGSLFFLGEIVVDMALPHTPPQAPHCGRCSACLDLCPTRAIIAPYRLDARRCISYLTIEHPGAIPQDLRPLLGNRVYGCDDCQLACPWNKFARPSPVADFRSRAPLAEATLVQAFGWSEDEFLRLSEGSPVRRIGHVRWLRNVAVALGNALRQGLDCRDVLAQRVEHPEPLVREHVRWALEQAPRACGGDAG